MQLNSVLNSRVSQMLVFLCSNSSPRRLLQRCAFIFLITTLIGSNAAAIGSEESSARTLLNGIWRLQTLQQFADGKLVRSQDTPDGSTIQFNSDGTWLLVTSRSQSSGTYRWLSGGSGESIETTIVQSNIPAQIGLVGIKQIRVDSTSLRLTTLYDEIGMRVFPPRDDGTRPKEMQVHSTFERVK
jgi:hypothetical protein